MTLRARIAAIATAAVAVAVLLTSVGAYVVTARALAHQADQQLVAIARDLARAPRRGLPGGVQGGPRTAALGGAGGFVQFIGPDGEPGGVVGDEAIPVSARARALAMAADPFAGRLFETVVVDARPVRVLTVPVRAGAVQVALPVDDDAAALRRLRGLLVLAGLAGTGVAAVLGLAVARRAVRPVQDLTELAEDVTRTGNLDRRITLEGDDELARLAGTFNEMLGSLAQARRAQQQLVADASHELRTPLTSLRTNIEVLADGDRLASTARRELIDDVVEQLAEFGRLVDGLVELARGEAPARAVVPVRLDELVELAVARASTFAPDREFVVDARPTTVLAEADRLDRAVTNLLDNAVKYGRGPIEVAVDDGVVRVRDHGPGFADAELEHAFDRFWRSPSARSAPGSGLGLSIVAQVAASHGGRATAGNDPAGGAVLVLSLPVTSPPVAPGRPHEDADDG